MNNEMNSKTPAKRPVPTQPFALRRLWLWGSVAMLAVAAVSATQLWPRVRQTQSAPTSSGGGAARAIRSGLTGLQGVGQRAASQVLSASRTNADGTITPGKILTAPPVQRTTAQIMDDQSKQPAQPVPHPPKPEREVDARRSLPQNPNASAAAQWPPASDKSPTVQPGAPQTPSTAFDGATGPTETGAFPPDTMGAVGPTQFVVFLNGRLRTFNKTTGVADGVINADSDVFFASVVTPPGAGEVSFTSDPQVRFDRLSNRWFLVIIDVTLNSTTGDTTRSNRILIAVSNTSTLTGATVWTFFQFTGDATLFTDYESLGIDANALYIGGNMFTLAGSFDSTKAFVLPKAPLLSSGPAVAWAFSGLAVGTGAGVYTPRGVDNYDPANTGPTALGYFVGVDNASFGVLAIRRVTDPSNTVSSPTMSANIAVSATLTTAFPRTVPHLGNTGGTNGNLDGLDDRLFAAHMRNGRLWTAHNINVTSAGVASGTANRNAARWYELQNLNATPSVVQAGTLFDNAASNPRNYWIPSVMVSGQGHVALGSSIAGVNERVNAFTTGRLSGDTLGTLRDGPGGAALPGYTSSSTAYNPAGDTGANNGARRWGDYSFTSLDPCDDMTMWTIQEYCNGANTYGARAVKLLAPLPVTPATASPASVATGQAAVNVTITGTSVNGTGFYDPGAGFCARIGATVTGVTVNSVTFNSPTSVTLSLNTTGATAGAKNVTITNPDGQSATGNGILTITGNNTAPSITPQAVNRQQGQPVSNSTVATVSDAETAAGSLTVNVNGGPSATVNGITVSNLVNTNGTITADVVAACNATVGPTNFTLNVSDGNLATPGTLTVTVSASTGPSITTNPTDQTVCVGGNATFTAAATGSPAPTVQWQESTDGGATFNNLAGQTNTTLTLNSVTAAQNNRRYRAVFTNACNTATTAAATLTVNTAPSVTTNPTDQTVCEGGNATFTVAATGTPTPTVQWQESTDGGATFNNLAGQTNTTLTLNAVTAAMNNRRYRAVFTNTCNTATTTAATLTVNTATSVTTNPTDQTVCASGNATFTAAASGTPAPTVQWQESTDGGATFNNLAGQTNTTLTLNSVTAAQNNRRYRAVFTNACNTATTTAATLTVNTAPSVTTNPTDQTVCEGGNATFTVAATGTPAPTVQWQESTDGGATFNNLAGQTNTTLTLNGVTAAMNNRRYRAVFTNTCNTATTTAATLTVNTAPSVTTNPTDQTVCAGNNATFTVAANGSPTPTVQWQESTDGGATFNNLAGQTNTTLTLTGVTLAMNNRRYRAVFTNTCSTATTTAATLTVNAALNISTQPVSQTICLGAPASFSVVASGAGTLTYQWRKNTVNIPGATNSTFSIASTVAGDAASYDVIVTGACGSITSNAATLVFNAATSITTQPQSQIVCAGAPASFSVVATGTGTLTYQWRRNTVNIPGATNSTFTINATVANDTSDYDVVVTGACGSVTSNAANLTVNTGAGISQQPVAQTVCAGQPATFSVTASGTTPFSYQWRKNTVNIPGATNSTFTINTTAAGDAGNYDVIVTNSCGTVTSNAIALTVNTAPALTTQPTDQTACPGANATFTAAASGTPAPTVQWQESTDGGATFNNLAGQTNTTLTLTGVTVAMNNRRYRAVFTNTCNTATSNAATLIVSNSPTITTPPANQAVCLGAPASFSVAANGTGPFTYQWRKNTVNIPGATNSTFSIASTVAGDAASYDVIVTGACGNITSNAATLSFNAATSITTQPQSQIVCAGAPASFSVVAAGTGPFSYQWRRNTVNIPGATNSTFTINATVANDTSDYDVVVTGACGSVTSNAANLTVNTGAGISQQPVAQTVCAGQPATFSVTASGTTPFSYQWRKNTVNIPGATNSTFTINTTAAGDAGNYDVIVTNSCGTVTSNAVALTINAATAITTQPTAQTVCAGQPATFSVTATGANLTYQWRKNTVNINGATNASFTLNAAQAADAGNYDVVVSGTCGSPVTSSAVALTVNPATAITTQPANQAVNAGQSATFSVVAAGVNLTYQWRKNGSNLNGETNSSLTLANVTPATAGNYDVVVTGTCGTATSNVATLTVNCPTINVAPAVLANAQQGTTYQQLLSATPAGSYTFSLTGGALPSGVTLTGNTLAGTPVVSGDFTFTITATDANQCTGTRQYTLSVCPIVTISPATLPSGTAGTVYPAQNFSATPAPPNGTLSWSATGTLPPGLTLSTAGVLSGTPTTAGSFTFSVSATGATAPMCAASRSYTLTINAGCPTITVNPATLPTGTAGVVYQQTLTQSGGAAPISWAVSAGALPPGWALNAATGQLGGLTLIIGTYNFTVRATDTNSCQGTRAYTVQIRPKAKADFDGDGKTDLSVWTPSTGNWAVLNSGNSATVTTQWGAGFAPFNDVIVPGDYDGDGKADHAIWRGADSIWYIRPSSNPSNPILQLWGTSNAPFFDIPTPGDFDGDGKTDLGVFRRDGTWFVKRSSDGGFTIVTHGQNGDTPIPADYDGDGKTDFAVFRPNAIAPAPNWFILQSSTNTVVSFQWGAGYAPYFDTPVPADYDGDGKADLAIWRGADSIWYIRPSATPNNPILQLWGTSNAPYFDIPIPGDYDGDGKADIAVWRRDGTWFVLRSTNGTFLIQTHGQNGDTPVPANGVR